MNATKPSTRDKSGPSPRCASCVSVVDMDALWQALDAGTEYACPSCAQTLVHEGERDRWTKSW